MKRALLAWTLGLGTLGLWTLAGCSSLGTEGLTNRCASEADCVTGSCDLERGMCVSTASDALVVGLEVVPSMDPFYGGSGRAVSFEPFEVAGATERDLRLPLNIPVYGRATDGLGRPITADVSFTTASRIPGTPSASISAQARSETMRDTRGEGFDYNFATQLWPGREYDVTVRPTGEWASELPPLSVRYVSPEADSHRLELVYPEPCSAAVMQDPTASASCLATITGWVRDAAGAPVDGVSVRVVDPVSGRTLSSTHTTGRGAEAVAGRFEVVLPIDRWRDLEGWLFRVTPTSERVEEHGLSQTFTVAPSALYEDDLGMVTILTPSIPSVVDYSGWVEGPGGVPAVGANLQFISRDVLDETTGAVGSFSATTTALGDAEACYGASPPDDCGLFEVSLLAGTYDIIITPSQSDPRQAALGVLRVERRIDPMPPEGSLPAEHIPVMGQLFSLPRRARYDGTVRTGGGEGMLNATVRAQALGTALGGELPPVARYARTNMSITDMNGLFSLELDVGVYDLVVEPPSGSNYPWLVVPNQAIASDATLSDVYELGSPVIVSGVAAFENPDADGSATVPVANGEVRAYALIDTADGGTRAVPIGRATTDAEGRYTLLLPPSL